MKVNFVDTSTENYSKNCLPIKRCFRVCFHKAVYYLNINNWYIDKPIRRRQGKAAVCFKLRQEAFILINLSLSIQFLKHDNYTCVYCFKYLY